MSIYLFMIAHYSVTSSFTSQRVWNVLHTFVLSNTARFKVFLFTIRGCYLFGCFYFQLKYVCTSGHNDELIDFIKIDASTCLHKARASGVACITLSKFKFVDTRPLLRQPAFVAIRSLPNSVSIVFKSCALKQKSLFQEKLWNGRMWKGSKQAVKQPTLSWVSVYYCLASRLHLSSKWPFCSRLVCSEEW